MTYDSACFDLAMTFLEDSKADTKHITALADLLAQEIQRCVEDFLEGRNL